MKFKLLLATLILVFAVAAPTFAQFGDPDTLIILTSRPAVGENDSTFKVELWMWHDEPTAGLQGGLTWTNPNMEADTAYKSDVSNAAWSYTYLWEADSVEVSNRTHRFNIIGISFGATIPASTSRQLLVTWEFKLSSWDAASEIIIDTASWDDGSEWDLGQFPDIHVPFVLIPPMPITVRDPSDANTGNGDNLPATFGLQQNYPNPFNPETTIKFTLGAAVDYELTVYNVLGQVVKQFNNQGKVGPNTVTWDASSNSSGIYFYKLKAGDFTETKKMALVK